MVGRATPTAPKGTLRCAVCGERASVKGAVYVRRPGYAHRDPVCAGCKPAKATKQPKPRRAPKGLVFATIPVSPLIPSAIDAPNAAVLAEEGEE